MVREVRILEHNRHSKYKSILQNLLLLKSAMVVGRRRGGIKEFHIKWAPHEKQSTLNACYRNE